MLGKLDNLPIFNAKQRGKINASLKSEMGEALLYQQRLPTLKGAFKVAFSKHALAI